MLFLFEASKPVRSTHSGRGNRLLESLGVLLHDGTVLGMEPHQPPESGEPQVPSDVELPLLVPHNPEVMYASLSVKEGEDQGPTLITTLPDQVGPWDIGRLQSLAGLNSI